MVPFVATFWNQIKTVDAMDKILDLIYEKFKTTMKDLEMGNMLTDKSICDMWEMMHAYELLDNNTLSLKEQQQIIEYYD